MSAIHGWPADSRPFQVAAHWCVRSGDSAGIMKSRCSTFKWQMSEPFSGISKSRASTTFCGYRENVARSSATANGALIEIQVQATATHLGKAVICVRSTFPAVHLIENGNFKPWLVIFHSD